MRTYTNAHAYKSCTQAHTTLTRVPIDTLAHMHTHSHTHKHTQRETPTNTHTHALSHIRTHTHALTKTRTHLHTHITHAQDYWTPGIEVSEGTEYQDRLGDVTPVPGHDGTECFKWDNMLWSSEAHFKVRVHVRLRVFFRAYSCALVCACARLLLF
jgi:hypothetical protein